MTNKELENQLETLVDRFGLKTVVDRLANVCWEKADHLRSNWGDKVLAKDWSCAASRIDNAGRKMPVLP
jgi:hypothetical protein